jgi:hypothetical protein
LNVLAHSLRISRRAWHARWYRYYIELGGKAQPSGRENLCRYVRVLLFWAPLAWFTRAKVNEVVRPWTITLTTVVLSTLTVSAVLWPRGLIKVLLVLGIIAGYVGMIYLVIMGINYVDDHKVQAKGAFKSATFPFWFPARAAYRATLRGYHRYQHPLTAAYDWYTHPFFWYVTPFWVSALAVLVVLGIFVPIVFLFVVGALVLAGIVVAWVYLVKRYRTGHPKREYQPVVARRIRVAGYHAYRNVAETVTLGATAVATKKRGSAFCPFITFRP